MSSSGPKPQPIYTFTRSFDRFAAYRDLEVMYEGRSEHVPVRAPDISSRGMFINTARHFAEGTVLKVSFRLTDSDRYIQTRAEVRFCLDGVGIGVEFVDISPEDQAAIEAHGRLPEPPPGT